MTDSSAPSPARIEDGPLTVLRWDWQRMFLNIAHFSIIVGWLLFAAFVIGRQGKIAKFPSEILPTVAGVLFFTAILAPLGGLGAIAVSPHERRFPWDRAVTGGIIFVMLLADRLVYAGMLLGSVLVVICAIAALSEFRHWPAIKEALGTLVLSLPLYIVASLKLVYCARLAPAKPKSHPGLIPISLPAEIGSWKTALTPDWLTGRLVGYLLLAIVVEELIRWAGRRYVLPMLARVGVTGPRPD